MNINKIVKKMRKKGIDMHRFYTAENMDKIESFFNDEGREILFLDKFRQATEQYQEFDDGYTLLNLPKKIKRNRRRNV